MSENESGPTSNGVKRRRLFSPADDSKLKSILTDSPFRGWKNVAQQMSGFTPKQLRDRWNNYLSPKNTFEPWTDEEDRIIVEKVLKYGTKWSLISTYLPGRPDNSIKNRWNSVLKNEYMIHPKKYLEKMKEKDVSESKDQEEEIPVSESPEKSKEKPQYYLDNRFVEHFFEQLPK
ncbi:Myb-like DNA-binding domain containing protein [Trichomonas vaginalis G3]|uniref:Myb-like DNA-binding domain containing protein n=1 Tax=Trichomonas vaginalis (strain ATCC PRA-98 / G3) TaxID=412133 RepID=A2FVN4_TRIV3|nr:RNA polymerase II transcription regulator recruiting protein [Trichomonas vaginalis G3]EAX91025.1 Myb-like DNA-binding domain containing protein [Trichomonas vaginalis G3]KAI5508127.1 RNA polymerase II transcription regulator recruiting protein [Trichomonas vaginalis G3]|eukprot:XP_001303955.1 Myb-like DNA-binding domain containing protein [Trichomonas vaginalis G3]